MISVFWQLLECQIKYPPKNRENSITGYVISEKNLIEM